MIGYLRLSLSWIAHSDRVGIPLMRVAIAIVFLWIGALKFAPYEADSITRFVAKSPFMSFFYEHPTEYKAHLTHEGELKPAERAWQTANNTYGFSDGLGTMEITIGLFFFQAEDGIRDYKVTGVQTCALPIFRPGSPAAPESLDARQPIREVDVSGIARPENRRSPILVQRPTAANSHQLRGSQIGRASCRERV